MHGLHQNASCIRHDACDGPRGSADLDDILAGSGMVPVGGMGSMGPPNGLGSPSIGSGGLGGPMGPSSSGLGGMPGIPGMSNVAPSSSGPGETLNELMYIVLKLRSST